MVEKKDADVSTETQSELPVCWEKKRGDEEGGGRRPQMMPYWASSCSSRWLKASQGQMTVMSVKRDRDVTTESPTRPPEADELTCAQALHAGDVVPEAAEQEDRLDTTRLHLLQT